MCGLNSGKFSCLTLEWPLVLVLFILALAFIPAFTKTRRLPPPLKCKAEDLLGMKVNKKMLQQQLSVESGRVVTLADLTVKMKQPISRNDLVHVVEFQEKDYSIRIFRNIDREIREIHKSILVVFFLSMHPYIIL